MGNIARAIKSIGTAAEKAGEMESKDLFKIREEINKILAELEKKIIIVIGDIDRLNNTEIRQVFQLVKSLGNFSNTVYLLSFDKSIVINALSKVQEGSGHSYLEKVIQVPFDVPVISEQDVHNFLFQLLNDLIKDIPEKQPNFWVLTYPNCGSYYLCNLLYETQNFKGEFKYTENLVNYFENLHFHNLLIRIGQEQMKRCQKDKYYLIHNLLNNKKYLKRISQTKITRHQFNTLFDDSMKDIVEDRINNIKYIHLTRKDIHPLRE